MQRPGDDVWILTVEPARAEGRLQEAYDLEGAMFGAATDLTRLGSLYPELALERLRLRQLVEEALSTLTPLERGLAAYVTSTLNGAARSVSELGRRLAKLNVPDRLLDNIRIGSGGWSVSDDDRIDVIVAYATRLTRAPADVEAADIDRLRVVGLTDLDIVDLNNIIAYYNYVDRVANGLGLGSTSTRDDERGPGSGDDSS